MTMRLDRTTTASGLLAIALVLAGAASAQEPCGICDEQVVTNSALAKCFLDEYPALAGQAKATVVVDLSACPQEEERSIVTPLGGTGVPAAEPSVTFMVTRSQLDCLKSKLEEPGLALDPSATIELGVCE
jgi:hypothetical protein